MQLIHTKTLASLTSSPTVVAVGNFDGIHRGHQSILQHVTQMAKKHDYAACLLTFEPYPQAFLAPDKAPARLTSLREKWVILQNMGLDYLYCLRFNHDLAMFSPEKFIQEILINKLHAKHIMIGEDFRFGYQRQGNIALLQRIKDFSVTVIPAIVENGERISSTAIRHALAQGNLEQAKQLLGRPYQIQGRVIEGDKRGRQLGFPTANIDLHSRMPAVRGVFAVKAKILGTAEKATEKTILGVANIGTRPSIQTINGVGRIEKVLLEVHLFNFSDTIYGKYLQVEFVQKIRDEQRFESIELLRKQIQEDVDTARRILA